MRETKYDVVIIGAGAAGLAAAYEFSLVNRKIAIVEARDRIGGRIHSIKDPGFSQVVETGAEFIHGLLPITMRLLEKAGIKHHNAKGQMWQVKNGDLQKPTDIDQGWGKLMRELKNLKEDISIDDFLNIHFKNEEAIKESILQFVEGYDAADAKKASALALRKEWEKDDEAHQGRIDEGYVELMNFLANESKKRGAEIYLSATVQTINWVRGQVVIKTKNEQQYTANKLLVTIPLGVWQANSNSEGYLQFNPCLVQKNEAAKKMGFGAVIKFNIQFETQFWKEPTVPHVMEKAGFIFSDAEIPTWWTQYPNENGLLNGWLAGPKAYVLKNEPDEDLFEKAIKSLAYIFKVPDHFIKQKILAYKINNWTADPYTRGAYSYATMDTHWAKKILAEPVEETLFFAGEALYEGSAAGTVEGALHNGIETAREIIASF